jgi:hypothetical protein
MREEGLVRLEGREKQGKRKGETGKKDGRNREKGREKQGRRKGETGKKDEPA